jgi:hypothetical protein
MVGVKLWHNPCWLSFRANYIAHHFNQPPYAWIGQRYKMTAPEHVVLYAVGLKDGIRADDIAESSARPKNTLSRAVNSLISKKLLSARGIAPIAGLGLHLTAGRRIVRDRAAFVAQEQAMASADAGGTHTLNRLLTVILGRPIGHRRSKETRHETTIRARQRCPAFVLRLLSASRRRAQPPRKP